MKTRLLLAAFFAIHPLSAAAQITITESTIRSLYEQSYSVSSYSADSPTLTEADDIVSRTGANQQWDFTSMTFTPLGDFAGSWDVVATAPGYTDPHFANADFIVRAWLDEGSNPDSAVYQFNTLDATSFNTLGSVFESPSVTSTSKYIPHKRTYALPLTMGTAWTSDYTLESETGGMTSSIDYEDAYQVVGYGTLTVPGAGGGSHSALMLRSESVFSFDAGGFTFSDTTITYSFITDDYVSAAISVDTDGTVTAATYTVSGDATTPNESDGALPRTAVLEQNFPNPFNPETRLRYELNEPAYVTLSVYDVSGRRVAVLDAGHRSAGPHEVAWNADSQAAILPSGVYLYRLEVTGQNGKNETTTRRMVLLK